MFRNRSVNLHDFSMVQSADVPRSAFKIQSTHKTTFDAGYLVPVYVDEVLPGDSFSLRMTAFARMSTPLFPVMDNLYLDSFFFFVPNRLVWTHWVNMMGEQDNPADSISFVVPQQVSPAGGYAVGSLQDYMGLPTVGQITGGLTFTHSALPLRSYNLIWDQWFRDENLQNSVVVDKGDGPDNIANYVLLRRGKRKDYFSGALPWPQKGGVAVSIPLGTSAPVVPTGTAPQFANANLGSGRGLTMTNAATTVAWSANAASTVSAAFWSVTGLQADLSSATAATINQLRQSFQIQKLLERDARGGTRYVELLWSHFRVRSPDARLQRPEYLGGSSTPINISPVVQNSGTGLTGGSTPLGNLAAIGTVVAHNHGFSQSFTEHGHIIGMVSVRADLTYQQGLRKMWSRSTRYDFYWPVFAMLGEQAVLNKEIYMVGGASGGQDDQVFGYQERWSEYRYRPSMITSLFKSTSAGTIDGWHLAQKFTALPTLNSTFIQDTPPLSRVLAVGAAANGQQIIFDSFFDTKVVRPLPMFSTPGLIDHF